MHVALWCSCMRTSIHDLLTLQELALACLASNPKERPSFDQILHRLQQLQSNVQAGPGRAFLRNGFATAPSQTAAVASGAATGAAGGLDVGAKSQGAAANQPQRSAADEAEPATDSVSAPPGPEAAAESESTAPEPELAGEPGSKPAGEPASEPADEPESAPAAAE